MTAECSQLFASARVLHRLVAGDAGELGDQAAGEGFGVTGHARSVACPGSAGNGSMDPSLEENAYVGLQSRAARAVCRVVQQETLEALGLSGHREPWRGRRGRLRLWCL